MENNKKALKIRTYIITTICSVRVEFISLIIIIFLISCEHDYIIHNQKELENFTTSNQTTIRGNLLIAGVNDLSPLLKIKKISGNLEFGFKEYEIYRGNPDLKSLNGLNNLISIEGDLRIRRTELTNLNGLDNLSSISKTLKITYNNKLFSLKGMRKISYVGQSINISNNQNLNSLKGLESVKDINIGLHLYKNESLKTLKGLDNLYSINGTFLIGNNTSLKTLHNLNNLNTVSGYFKISGNSALKSLSGLTNLDSIGGDFIITHNNSLKTLEGLDNLKHIKGNLEIGYMKPLHRGTFDYGNKKLIDFCALQRVIISGKHHIEGNLYNPTNEEISINDNCKLTE